MFESKNIFVIAQFSFFLNGYVLVKMSIPSKHKPVLQY